MPTFYVLLHADDDKKLYWDEPVTQAQFEAASWEKIIDVPNTGAIGYGYTGPLTYYPLELNHEGGGWPREGDSEGYAIIDPCACFFAYLQNVIRYELDADGVVRPHFRLNLLDGAILAYENAREVVNVPGGGLHNGLYSWGGDGAGIEIYEASAYRIYLPKKSPVAPLPPFWAGFRQCKEVLK